TNFAIKIILSIFGPILKKPIEWITKFLFLDAYKVSTAYRTSRDLQLLWRKDLGGFVNYSINWNQIFLGKQQTNCTLWVKANNDQHYSKVIFCVTASLSNLKYQSVIEIHDLTSKPCVLALPSIPIRNLEWRNGQLYEPYNEFKIELKEVFDKDNTYINLKNNTKSIFNPVDNLGFLQGKKSYVYRWGQWWNLDFLESEKDEFLLTYKAYAFRAKFDKSNNASLFSARAWLLSNRLLLNVFFWSKNIFKAKHLRVAFDKYLKDIEEAAGFKLVD
ncbi:hypothetical protein LLI36_003728, partial [Acinetobacter baumannii]